MSTLLLILVVVLGVIAIGQIARIYHLAASLRTRREEDISDADNKLNANLMLLFVFAFFGFFIWLLVRFHGVLLPVSASKHGVLTDHLMNVNMAIIILMFVLVNFTLFFFSYKYARKKGTKAFYLAHNNNLELIWTVIPSIVLAFLIIYGLITWNHVMSHASKDAMTVEVYGKQFNWIIRYAGDDNRLGPSNYNLISTSNPLGIITPETIDAQVKDLKGQISDAQKELDTQVLPDEKVAELKDNIAHWNRQIGKILNYKQSNLDFGAANDDKVVTTEFHIPVGRQISLVLHSQDVIHSAYMPHFRVQMNCVPGMTTRFKFTPTITTDSMRTIVGDKNFDYILLCNKVCGAAHYNMNMKVVVDTPAEFKKWLADQKPFGATSTAEVGSGVGKKIAQK